MRNKPATVPITGDDDADRFLAAEPLALVIGMLLNQQAPLARAFLGPFLLNERLGGTLDPRVIASADPDELAALFAQPPALHQSAAVMATRTQSTCRFVLDHHGGHAERIWDDATTGDELLAAIKAIPGFGDRMSRIFVVLLAERLGVKPPGWEEVAGPHLKRVWFSVSPAPKPWTPAGRARG